ncbi:ribokinase [Fundicoccus culcitae]|uniref:Deoxyribokinase n=1 Tax=Fundicoccus culcitae TaxID=2969821 RepID=A0ABY5P4T0_9LACT|nr:ribokinase [Fundicoccus culcitae]UUX33759.1 ribokinase [Fundicoccus culcitae]
MTILVLGSFMMDHVVTTKRAPKNGETIVGKQFEIFPGGKGANQAVAASRLGLNVIMAGKVGSDYYGDVFINLLEKEGIDVRHIVKDKDKSTGVGFVTVEENGDNRIIVVLGANLSYDSQDLSELVVDIAPVTLAMFQLEMDFDLTEEAINVFYQKQIPVLLNPAPARTLSNDLLSKVTYLTPNESELELLTGYQLKNMQDVIEAAKSLLDKGTENVIVTLGDKGALIVNKELVELVDGYTVEAVDTVAAGDAFNGAFAYAISSGYEIIQAVKFANAVGALTITKKGAIPSIPTYEEVQSFIDQKE